MAQRVPLTRCIDPRTRDFADHDRKFWRREFAAEILDEVHEIRFVLRHRGFRFAAVVPTVVPNEACEFGRASGERGDFIVGAIECGAHVVDHHAVVGANFATRRWRTEVLVETLAAPRRFHKQHRLVHRVAEHVAELEFGAEMMLIEIRREAERERAELRSFVLLALVADKDVVARLPRAVGVAKVGNECRGLGVLRDREQRSATVVVVLAVEVDDAVTLHVRLAGQDEDFVGLRSWCARRLRGASRTNDCQRLLRSKRECDRRKCNARSGEFQHARDGTRSVQRSRAPIT